MPLRGISRARDHELAIASLVLVKGRILILRVPGGVRHYSVVIVNRQAGLHVSMPCTTRPLMLLFTELYYHAQDLNHPYTGYRVRIIQPRLSWPQSMICHSIGL